CDFSDQIQGAEKGDSILDQRSKCPRELRVIAIANYATIAGDSQAKAVPGNASLVASHEGAKSEADSDHDEKSEPPVARDHVMGLHQNTRWQRKRAANLRHKTG